jgi:DNA invertase Pin-like site-specific DNA recombinase
MIWSDGRSTSWRKEAIHVEGKQDLQTKMMIALFGLFAEVERDLISERTKEGLQGAKTQGRLLGRLRGTLGQFRAYCYTNLVGTLSPQALDDALARRLWEVSERLTRRGG